MLWRCAGALAALAALALLAAGCAGQPPAPVLSPLAERAERLPVVLVPGVTGAKLRDPASGARLWGDGRQLLAPRDGGYALALPLDPDGAWAARAEADAVIEEIHLGPIKKPIYGPFVRLLEANGYRRGDLGDPHPGETLFLFPYDWRQENSRSARLLLERLEALQRVRGEVPLKVVLVCQSNGAHICRYLAKYGGASLAEAEAGGGGLPPTVVVDKVVLVGTSNGGGLRILRELDRGRRYVPAVGRRWRPEVLFTFPSLYEDLPTYRPDFFVDAAGEPLDVDLYDAAAWERYGWSAFAPETRRRIARRRPPGLPADPERLRTDLAELLATSKRFHVLLHRDSAHFGATRYYSVQNVADPTPDRAVLERSKRGWRLLFTGDKALARRPGLAAQVTARGDGHAPVVSQRWLSPQETAALAAPTVEVAGEHFELINGPLAERRLLDILED